MSDEEQRAPEDVGTSPASGPTVADRPVYWVKPGEMPGKPLEGITFQMPDGGPEIQVRRGFWSTSVVSGGQKLRRGGRFRQGHILALPDGTTKHVRIRGILNATLELDGQKFPLERRLRSWEYVLAALPLVLAIPGVTGGALGFALGFGGAFANSRLARRSGSAPVRAGAMLGLSASLVVLYVIVAVSLSTAVTVFVPPAWEKMGSCWSEIPTGASISDIKTIDCASLHAAEVYAVPVVKPEDIGGNYSGERLSAWSEQACIEAFAPFVGLVYDSSRYEVLSLYPLATSWAVGDRLIVCALYDPNGGLLVGSLKGIAR